jgi:cysteine desulfurase / selenocysteine lyase
MNNSNILADSSDFPGLAVELDGSRVTYLDNAATTLKPSQMVDAMNEYYLGISSNVHRGKNYSLELVSNRYEEARYKVAELLSCSGNEVVFLRNTTEAINLVANGLQLSKEDEVIVFSDAHHSNLLPWMENAKITLVDVNPLGALDLSHYYSLLKTKPKVVAITHCSNVTGVYCPLKEMVSAAKEVGAIVVVDAAQSVPHRKINLSELDIDFLTFSAHKMLGPTGLGVLYGNKVQLDKLKPMNLGGGMVDWVEKDSYNLRKIPHRFEAGTPHIAGAYGLTAAIDYLNNIGFDRLEEHDRTLGRYLYNEAKKREYLKIINQHDEADRGAVVSFEIPTAENLDDVARVLSDSYAIMCRNGHLCAQPYLTDVASGQVIRFSCYLYNTQNDVDKAFSALDEISQYMFY